MTQIVLDENKVLRLARDHWGEDVFLTHIADRAGLSRGTVYRTFRTTRWSGRTLNALICALGCAPADILTTIADEKDNKAE